MKKAIFILFLLLFCVFAISAQELNDLEDVFSSTTYEEAVRKIGELGFEVIPGKEREEIKPYINPLTGEQLYFSDYFDSSPYLTLKTGRFASRREFNNIMSKNGWQFSHISVRNYDITYVNTGNDGRVTQIEHSVSNNNDDKSNPVTISIFTEHPEKIFSVAGRPNANCSYDYYRIEWLESLMSIALQVDVASLELTLSSCNYIKLPLSNEIRYNAYRYNGEETVLVTLNDKGRFGGRITVDMGKMIPLGNKPGPEFNKLLESVGYVVPKISKKEKRRLAVNGAPEYYFKEKNGLRYKAWVHTIGEPDHIAEGNSTICISLEVELL